VSQKFNGPRGAFGPGPAPVQDRLLQDDLGLARPGGRGNPENSRGLGPTSGKHDFSSWARRGGPLMRPAMKNARSRIWIWKLDRKVLNA